LWIGEYLGNRVSKLTAVGTIQPVAGTGTAGFSGDSRQAASAQLQAPGQLARDAAGNLYIADSGNNRIRKMTPQGVISTFAGTGIAGLTGDGGQAATARLNLPRGVAVDAAANVYIADTGSHRIRKVTPGGLITTVAGGGSVTLNLPRSVIVGIDQNLYIADTGNQRILKLTPAGDLSTIAGLGSAGFSGDGGDALAAQFSAPAALATDAVGNLYVADFDNGRIRKLTPSSSGIAAPITQLPASLLNAASLGDGPVAPGEILSILADGLGPVGGQFGVFDENGLLGTLLAETQVLFDGLAAPMIYVQQSEIKVQAPYELTGLPITHVQVFHSGEMKVDAFLAVADAAPGIFTISGGTGPALVFGQDGLPNSQTNPADAGSLITLFATGEGQTLPAGIDGARVSGPYPQPAGAMDVRVGGQSADIVSVAAAFGAPGILQVTARIPAVTVSGPATLSLAVSTAVSQAGVTVFVK
jgi:uncharacterized protein (TIGR03437 family)